MSQTKKPLADNPPTKKSHLSGPFWLRGKLEMNPIAPREEAVLEDDVDDIHNPGNPAKEDIKDDRDNVAGHRIFDDTIDQNQDIEEDDNQNLHDARQSINKLNVTHSLFSFRLNILLQKYPAFTEKAMTKKK